MYTLIPYSLCATGMIPRESKQPAITYFEDMTKSSLNLKWLEDIVGADSLGELCLYYNTILPHVMPLSPSPSNSSPPFPL